VLLLFEAMYEFSLLKLFSFPVPYPKKLGLLREVITEDKFTGFDFLLF
jgi:hypothetical protein